MKRENFQSRLGFLLVSAGCAIGIGNVWKFPYVTGENGGGVFVLFYVLFLVIMGVPVLTMELAVGRASRKSAVLGYKALEPKGSKWHIHGWFCVIGCCLLMMYYTTVSGWMLDYFYKFTVGCLRRRCHRCCGRRVLLYAGQSRRDGRLHGDHCAGGLSGVLLRPSEGIGAHQQVDDAGAFGADCGSGSSQPHPGRAPWRA